MMFKYSFDLPEESAAIEKAVDAVLAAGWHTADTMGSEDKLVGCKKMGSLICEELGK